MFPKSNKTTLHLLASSCLLIAFSGRGFAQSQPATNEGAIGVASYYGKPYHGRKTASGVIFDMNKMTAAHPTLPFGQKVRVTNLNNGQSVDVVINDRGPFVHKRTIDLSQGAARKIDMIHVGIAKVRVELLKS